MDASLNQNSAHQMINRMNYSTDQSNELFPRRIFKFFGGEHRKLAPLANIQNIQNKCVENRS